LTPDAAGFLAGFAFALPELAACPDEPGDDEPDEGEPGELDELPALCPPAGTTIHTASVAASHRRNLFSWVGEFLSLMSSL
jgi:hypothetical protein